MCFLSVFFFFIVCIAEIMETYGDYVPPEAIDYIPQYLQPKIQQVSYL